MWCYYSKELKPQGLSGSSLSRFPLYCVMQNRLYRLSSEDICYVLILRVACSTAGEQDAINLTQQFGNYNNNVRLNRKIILLIISNHKFYKFSNS